MSRANVAGGSARAGTMQGLVRSLEPDTRSERAAAVEALIRKLVPVAALLFVLTFAAGSFVQMMQARDRAKADGFSDMELIGSLVASDLNQAIADAPQIDITSLLQRNLPSRALAAGRRILVTDPAGFIIGALPASQSAVSTLAETLGPSQALTVFADKAGVMPITLPDGTEALATVRTLHGRFGQVLLGW